MNFKLRLAVLALLLASVLTPVHAVVELPDIFGNNMVFQSGEPLHFWGWADPGEKVIVKQGDIVIANTEGQGKDIPWRVILPAQKPGPVADIQVTGSSNTLTLTNILAGEDWLFSGQSNMVKTIQAGPWCPWGGVLDESNVIAAATDSQIRLFLETSPGNKEPQSRPKGEWWVCSPQTVPQFSAVAYFFALHLRSALKVPVGLIVSAVGGTPAEAWTPARALISDADFVIRQAQAKLTRDQFAAMASEDKKALNAWKTAALAAKAVGQSPPPKPVLKLTREQTVAVKNAGPLLNPGILYNGKIHPLAPFNIKGAFWYQGESNAERAENYAGLMTHLIESWREDWGKPFPFVQVALAGFGQPVPWTLSQGSYPLIREAAIKDAQTLPAVGVISAVDIGEAGNIHPHNKQTVGERAALWALQNVYGENVISEGPTFGKADFTGGKAIVHFSGNAEGLMLKGHSGFELAGADQKFIPATATVHGDTLEVVAPILTDPIALRYAFLNFPECTIYNSAGLPALPFRTDTWPVVPAASAP